jgi:hypothetical protein
MKDLSPDKTSIFCEFSLGLVAGLDCLEVLAAETSTNLPIPKKLSGVESFLMDSPGYGAFYLQDIPIEESPSLEGWKGLGTGAGLLANISTCFIPQAIIFGTRLLVPPTYRLARDLLCNAPVVGELVCKFDDFVQGSSD